MRSERDHHQKYNFGDYQRTNVPQTVLKYPSKQTESGKSTGND